LAEHLGLMGLALQTKPYHRRFRQPLQTAHGLWVWRQGLLVRVQDCQGRVGYGEIAPMPWFGSETLAQATAFCAQGEAVFLTDSLCPPTLPATQFGLATALAQLQPDQAGLVPPAASAPPALCGLLPAGFKALTAWQPLWQQGIRTFKWKIGVAPVEPELSMLETLGQTLPAASRLRLDANGGLTVATAEQWLAVCDRINTTAQGCTVEYLEQPLPVAQVAAMQRLAARFQTPIALDESVATLAQMAHHHRQGWRGIFVVKPAIAGCPHQLRQFWQQHSPQLVFSSAFETGVGRQAALALAAAYQRHSGSSLALGFGTLGYFKDDWDTLTPAQLWNRL
jgi:o-succinylbenzoate synthase